jgi:hypothetical protein
MPMDARMWPLRRAADASVLNIIVAFWQRPHCVQVIRQDHECINVKRVPPFPLFRSRAQNRHVVYQQAKLTLRKVHREEVGAAFCIRTPISHFCHCLACHDMS